MIFRFTAAFEKKLISKLQQLPFGDISTLPNTNRVCDIAGHCTYWQQMLPSDYGFNNFANIRTNEIIL